MSIEMGRILNLNLKNAIGLIFRHPDVQIAASAQIDATIMHGAESPQDKEAGRKLQAAIKYSADNRRGAQPTI